LASAVFAQGTNTGGQQKNDWEEINFEFNSSVLSDGYPGLLRLAELLGQHHDYKVRVTGHTDHVGSAAYNDKLAMRRAESVKAFLVRYGAADNQITTAGDGKRAPEVDNKTKEGRFMNRRVVLTVMDGRGNVVKEGGMGEVVPFLEQLNDVAKKQQECCDQILKKLDKLDDILAALKNLQGENDKLRAEMNDQRNQLNALKDQVNGLPKPLSATQTQDIAHTEAMGAVDEAQKRNKKFSNININIGPNLGSARTGDFSVDGRGQFFSPLGGDAVRAVQAQGEYLYYPGRQEGQFDIGFINRFGPSLQAGAFGSFKYLNFKDMQSGGGLGQAAFLLDYIFSRGRVGIFATKGFKNTAVLSRVQIGPQSFTETYARIADQVGFNGLVGAWGKAYIEGNLGYIRSHRGNNSPGGQIRLVQPFTEHFAFTVEGALNESLLATSNTGRIAFGFQVGNYIHPKDYGKTKSPVPMDVPRVRYELLTRRVGDTPPVANAGPNQNNAAAGTITLDGSASYDPDGDPITFAWSQVSGPAVTLATPTAAKTTFTAAAGQTYVFKLTVTDSFGLSNSATTKVSTGSTSSAAIVRFDATPNQIAAGQASTLTWVVQGATSVSINNGVGNVALTGSTTVSPAQSTTYTLTAVGPSGNVAATTTVTVGGVAGNPQIVRYEASPLTITPAGSSTLSWATTGAATVSISGVGNVPVNGSTTVSPTTTTTYTLTATSSDGKNVTAPVTVTVSSGTVPQIVVFVATPQNIDAGQSTKLCWQVTGATSIQIQPGVGSNLNANDCATVSPATTTTYTLTATNASGQNQGNATVNVGQVRILSFTANPPTSPSAGSPVQLSWQTQNATSVVLVGSEISPQNLQPNGTFTVNPITNSIYTLTAYGPGGQTVSVTIGVFVR
jgi:hypothetical protein